MANISDAYLHKFLEAVDVVCGECIAMGPLCDSCPVYETTCRLKTRRQSIRPDSEVQHS